MAAILSGLSTAATRLGTFLVELVGFLVVLAIGWIVARVVQGIIAGVLHRLRFDNLVERGGMKAALQRTGYDASGILGRIGFWAVMLFTLQFAFGVFGPNPVLGVLNSVIAYLPRVFAAALIVIIGAALAAFVRDALDAAIGGVSYGKTIASVSAGAVIYVATFMALDELAIATSIVTGLFYASLAAIAGTVIVAAGGGGIPTMQRWWDRASNRVEQEAPTMMQQAQGASERVKQRTQQRAQQAKQMQQGEQQPVGAGARTGGGTTPGEPMQPTQQGTMRPDDGRRG